MIHWEAINPAMRRVMEQFGTSEISNRFYLAGGTALALQLGHRRSFDLADQEAPPTLTQDVPWDTVKAFFRNQAVEIGRRWID